MKKTRINFQLYSLAIIFLFKTTITFAGLDNEGFGTFRSGSKSEPYKKLHTTPTGDDSFGSSSNMWINNTNGNGACSIDIDFRVFKNKATATKKAHDEYQFYMSTGSGNFARSGFRFRQYAGGKMSRGESTYSEKPFTEENLNGCVDNVTNLQQSYTGVGESTVIKLSFDYRFEDAILRYTGIASKATGAKQSVVVIKGP